MFLSLFFIFYFYFCFLCSSFCFSFLVCISAQCIQLVGDNPTCHFGNYFEILYIVFGGVIV